MQFEENNVCILLPLLLGISSFREFLFTLYTYIFTLSLFEQLAYVILQLSLKYENIVICPYSACVSGIRGVIFLRLDKHFLCLRRLTVGYIRSEQSIQQNLGIQAPRNAFLFVNLRIRIFIELLQSVLSPLANFVYFCQHILHTLLFGNTYFWSCTHDAQQCAPCNSIVLSS